MTAQRVHVRLRIVDDDLEPEVQSERVHPVQQAPTALICVNSPTALRLIRPLRDAGLRVPQDVSLASFDDQVWCNQIETSLTTMSPRIDEVARLLFETLMARIENPQAPPVRHCVRQKFHERESTGPAHAAQ